VTQEILRTAGRLFNDVQSAVTFTQEKSVPKKTVH